MTAQPQELGHVRAYVFVRVGSADTVGIVASSIQEAEVALEKLYDHWPKDLAKPVFFNIAVARMQLGMIEWYDWRNKRFEGKGYYAFLKGIFFCKCGDHEVATHCAKYQDSRGRWTATIYGGNHYVTPM